MEGHAQYVEFLRMHSCYDILPLSSRIVVFDTNLLVKKAFHALVQNGMRSAPLWDSVSQEFVGMITVSDFINILRQQYKSPLVSMDELENHRIQTWRELMAASLPGELIQIEPHASLLDAVHLLLRNKIHRLPVIDAANGVCTAVLTQKRLLNFICANFRLSSTATNAKPPAFLGYSIFDLGIGSYHAIATATLNTPLIDILNVFAERRVSAVPIVDDGGRVIDVYAKADVRNLARDKLYEHLEAPMSAVIALPSGLHDEDFEGVCSCKKSDSLAAIIERIVKAQVHRLVVVDDDDHVVGIVSLSDILSFLLGLSTFDSVASSLSHSSLYQRRVGSPGDEQ